MVIDVDNGLIMWILGWTLRIPSPKPVNLDEFDHDFKMLKTLEIHRI